jgi:hypothetical protein
MRAVAGLGVLMFVLACIAAVMCMRGLSTGDDLGAGLWLLVTLSAMLAGYKTNREVSRTNSPRARVAKAAKGAMP